MWANTYAMKKPYFNFSPLDHFLVFHVELQMNQKQCKESNEQIRPMYNQLDSPMMSIQGGSHACKQGKKKGYRA